MSSEELIYSEWLDRLKLRVGSRAPSIDLNKILPAVAERLGLQDPFQYIADHDGKGQTLCKLLGALTLAEAGRAVAYASHGHTRAAMYAHRAKMLVTSCESSSTDRITFDSGGEVRFLHPKSSIDELRFHDLIEDD